MVSPFSERRDPAAFPPSELSVVLSVWLKIDSITAAFQKESDILTLFAGDLKDRRRQEAAVIADWKPAPHF
jgi:hypothetical protein